MPCTQIQQIFSLSIFSDYNLIQMRYLTVVLMKNSEQPLCKYVARGADI